MTAPGEARDTDPEETTRSLAKERTDMAWTRTAISFAAAGAAILKNHVVAGVIVLALAVLTWGLRRLFPGDTTDGTSRERRLLLVTIAVTAVGVVALGVALTAQTSGR